MSAPLSQTELVDLATEFGLPPDSYFGDWEPIAEWQRAVLAHFGGVHDRTILDVGCGAARLGSVILPELGDGLYVGVDPIDEYIGLAWRIAERLGARERMRLDANSEFRFPIEGRVVDIAIAQSVFTHLTERDIETCLERMKPLMKEGAPFVFTFIDEPQQRSRGSLYLRKYPFIRKRPADDGIFRRWADANDARYAFFDEIQHPTGQRSGVITF